MEAALPVSEALCWGEMEDGGGWGSQGEWQVCGSRAEHCHRLTIAERKVSRSQKSMLI